MANEVLECLKDISHKLNTIYELLKTQDNTHLNIHLNTQQFADCLGISIYKLKMLYKQNELAIPNPERMDQTNPKFTYADVEYMRKFLSERR